jgi:hypothetical protein
MVIVTTWNIFCGKTANSFYVASHCTRGTDISQIFLKIRMKIREVLFGEKYYMKSDGNLNSKAVISVIDRAPLPHRRQWMTPLHVCTPTSFQIICVMSSWLEVCVAFGLLLGLKLPANEDEHTVYTRRVSRN